MGGHVRRRGAVAIALAVTAAIGVASLGAPASGEGGMTFEVGDFPPDEGVLRLHLGSDGDHLRYEPADGTDPVQEAFAVSACNLASPLTSAAGATLTPEPLGGGRQGRLGLVNHGLGVQVKGEGNGTPCGQVNGTQQALTLALTGVLEGKQIDFAELDLEGKFGVTVRAEMFLEGELVGTETYETVGPDSGPDSADGDNFRVRLPESGTTFFDEVRLSVDPSTPTAAFSLEGGADGTAPLPGGYAATELGGTTNSIFHITDIDLLDCGETATAGGGADEPTVEVTHVADGCTEAIPYSLSVGTTPDGNQAILFQKNAELDSEFLATFTWAAEEAAYPVPPTQIDFGDGAQDMQWCAGTYEDPVPPSPEVPWCLRRHSAELRADGMMQVVEEVYGLGDPFSFR